MNTVVIIPAYNEQDSIAKVIGDIPQNLVSEIIVVDNNSNDGTSDLRHEMLVLQYCLNKEKDMELLV